MSQSSNSQPAIRAIRARSRIISDKLRVANQISLSRSISDDSRNSGLGVWVSKSASGFAACRASCKMCIRDSCWADGSPLTAQDVKASLYLDMLEDATMLEHITAVETPSDDQVVIRFETPAEPLLAACLDQRIKARAADWQEGMAEMDAVSYTHLLRHPSWG